MWQGDWWTMVSLLVSSIGWRNMKIYWPIILKLTFTMFISLKRSGSLIKGSSCPCLVCDHVCHDRYNLLLSPTYIGFKDVEEYYSACSTDKKIEKVAIPLLCLCAQDDPICSSRGIPYESFTRNDKIFLVVLPHGGHLAWLRNYPVADSSSWMEDCAIEFIEAVNKMKLASPSQKLRTSSEA